MAMKLTSRLCSGVKTVNMMCPTACDKESSNPAITNYELITSLVINSKLRGTKEI